VTHSHSRPDRPSDFCREYQFISINDKTISRKACPVGAAIQSGVECPQLIRPQSCQTRHSSIKIRSIRHLKLTVDRSSIMLDTEIVFLYWKISVSLFFVVRSMLSNGPVFFLNRRRTIISSKMDAFKGQSDGSCTVFLCAHSRISSKSRSFREESTLKSTFVCLNLSTQLARFQWQFDVPRSGGDRSTKQNLSGSNQSAGEQCNCAPQTYL
jgi:hypothetical protein